jgi:hypothetical protein
MPVSAALGADLLSLSLRLCRTATAMTMRTGRPRGAPHSPSTTPRWVPNHRRRAEGAACSCPCSVELPGEAA